MANTNILIKRSLTTGKPASLQAGEFAYSYSSNTLFFGSPTGNGTVNVGGQYYTATLDAATTSNTASTLVKRDLNGAFAGRLTGIADKADQLTNSRNFSISGTDITATAQSFNGTGDVTLNAALNAVPGLSAGSYGSTTAIPVLTIGANGRVLAVSTAGITTSFTVAADGGSNQTVSGGDTLTLVGGAGITSTASATDIVTFDVDNTVVRSNTAINNQTINSSLSINGNLNVLGTQTYVNTNTLNVADPLIYLAANNSTSDIVDIGFAGRYFDGAAVKQTGLFRDAGNKQYYVFDNYTPALDANNDINAADSSFRVATLNANLTSQQATITTANITATTIATANVSGNLSIVGDTYHTGKIVVTGTTTLTGQANTTNDLGVGGNSYVTGNQRVGGTLNVTGATTLVASSNTTNDLGIGGNLYAANKLVVTGTTTLTGQANTTNDLGVGGNAYITGTLRAASLSLTGALTVPNGGTGVTSFSSGGLLIGNGTGAINQLANTTYTVTGTPAANNTVTSMTVDAYGRTTAKTYAAIAGLTVGQGGTGVSSFTTNGITYGNGTDAVQVTAAAGTSDQTFSNQILTVTNAGVPVWSTALDGGQF